MKHVAELSGEEVPVPLGRLPYLSVDLFCGTDEARQEFVKATADRRMSRVRANVYEGGVAAAIKFYQSSGSPDLIVLESTAAGAALIDEIDALAPVCDSDTKVLIIGYSNDVPTYRTLLKRGVSEYLVGPIEPLSLIGHIAALYVDSNAPKLGRSFAFIGSSGGVGSSTAAQNIASAIGQSASRKVVLADLDLPFGAAGLNLDLEDRQGVAEAVQDAARLDEVLLERLMSAYDTNLNVLTAPASLEHTYDLESNAFLALLDVAQASVPYVVLDVPHVWTSWSRSVLVASDEVIVTAIPDLANLRNAKHIIEVLKRARPNDRAPRLLLNQVGVPKRKEIKPKDFTDAVGAELLGCIPFEPSVFSAAAINGKMVGGVAGKSRASKNFAEAAAVLIRGPGVAKPKRRLADLFRRSSGVKKV